MQCLPEFGQEKFVLVKYYVKEKAIVTIPLIEKDSGKVFISYVQTDRDDLYVRVHLISDRQDAVIPII